MQLHQLKPLHKNRNKKRVGRGGKRGTTSGRGTKGQKSRSGHRIRPAERDLIQRLPKLRGFKNKPLESKPAVVNVGDLEKKIKGDIISKESLLEAGFIRKSDKRVKILGKGEVNKSFRVEKLGISESAKKKIEAAGGKILP
ncbi:MAG: 50S ribosomal protein L15 [Candidatus Wolfebacteria bacterium GW2011_GWA2_42_10]|uniref:Large ribosomal subunit protein uL15 n=2 Tax=Candidatus Wolfeibacteriota TaxID=1752735 RepID=A0A0G1AK51_9BACT|nr:MAG: 50S ribosomal protein L15 [Candidatus Wolfebacteria bacterium GW2011_GWB1_41_12]KKS25628.1 MAG: 50S ribosomal protein L15 [Candidatus Wolfebacteria bacterium GW2011_GWA2_42_10]KKT56482.1 MAG: 50S ribosomal protein L15 [Candidatus Wolfebacteria bacterium GW2011_GWA1_44_24]